MSGAAGIPAVHGGEEVKQERCSKGGAGLKDPRLAV